MKFEASTPEEYIAQLPEDRKEALEKLRRTVKAHLPGGFEEAMSYGMIGYVIPHSLYAPGYHANPKEPVPFISLASQKNHIAFYHMALQLFPDILTWFTDEYARRAGNKLDMAKSCIRFKNPAKIPYELLAELCEKITPEEYLSAYLLALNRTTR